jgi:hypothetical protein
MLIFWHFFLIIIHRKLILNRKNSDTCLENSSLWEKYIYEHELSNKLKAVIRETVTWGTAYKFLFSMAFPAHSGPRPLIQFRNHFSQTVGLLGRVINLSQGRYLNIGQHKHRINAYTHTKHLCPECPAVCENRSHVLGLACLAAQFLACVRACVRIRLSFGRINSKYVLEFLVVVVKVDSAYGLRFLFRRRPGSSPVCCLFRQLLNDAWLCRRRARWLWVFIQRDGCSLLKFWR